MEIEAKLSDELYKKFRELFYKRTGIYLKDYKKYLVEYRLLKFVGPGRRFNSFEDLYNAIENDKTGGLTKEFVNSLTTNYTYFFREEVHFDFLKNYLRQNIHKEPYIRFWSAGCSTGEEAYSISISCFEAVENPFDYDLKILATDISLKVIEVANQGIYHYNRMLKGSIEDKILKRYFIFDRENKDFILKDEVKRLVAFRYLNLMDNYPFKKKFDIVFLRNVLIYFDIEEKEYILDKIFDVIKDNGYMILGLSESLVGVKHKFQILKNSIYHKRY
ncbi:MAG: CheR family methyltransferase [Brevinematia bacterium]